MRTTKASRLLLAAAFAMTAVAVAAPLATADAVYHSQHIALNPIAGAPLRSGFVENIHADGPQVYAHELYLLDGAEPDTANQVTLLLYPFDPSCLSGVVPIPTASFQTNPAGDGIGQFIFRPGDVPAALRGMRRTASAGRLRAVAHSRRNALRAVQHAGDEVGLNGEGADGGAA
jgi:hypothetical protein